MALSKMSKKKSNAKSTPKKTKRRSKPRKQAPSLKIQIDLSEDSRIGPGKIKLLEAIDQAGSLSQGAVEMGISYRRAWLFMTQINESFDQPAIATSARGRGGSPSQLTSFGRKLISVYREMEVEAEDAAARGMTWIKQHRK